MSSALLGYSPPNLSFTLSGTGAAFLTDVVLTNGRPTEVTRIQWLSTGTPATTDTLEVRGQLGSARVLRVFALLGLSCPAGVKVHVLGKRAADGGFTYDLGGNTQSAVTRELHDGTIGVWFLADAGKDAVEAIAFRFYNDLGGSTWADADTELEIGEAVAMPAVALSIRGQGTDVELVDPSQRSRGIGSQLATVAYVPYRQWAVKLSPADEDTLRGDTLATGVNLLSLDYALAGSRPAVVIPQWQDDAGALDVDRLHDFAMYAVAERIGANKRGAGRHWDKDWLFSELPAALTA